MTVRKRKARRRAIGSRTPILVEAKANPRCSLDFVHDQFALGRRFRILNIVDDVTRECLAAIPDTSISGKRVARELTVLIGRRGKPRMIVSDNGTEFTSNAILGWAKDHSIDWHYIAPGRPMQNGYISPSMEGCVKSCSTRAYSSISIRPARSSVHRRLQHREAAFLARLQNSGSLCRYTHRAELLGVAIETLFPEATATGRKRLTARKFGVINASLIMGTELRHNAEVLTCSDFYVSTCTTGQGDEEAIMSDVAHHWITPFIPVLLMLSIVVANHVVAGQRSDRKTAAEASRFSVALSAELRAMLDLYSINLDLIEKKAGYLLSTRSSIAIYKGNLGRLTALLEKAAIGRVVEVFAQNERIESVVAAHSNLKCNLTYQFSPADSKFDEWKLMYEQASLKIAFACQALEDNTASTNRPNDAIGGRAPFYQLIANSGVLGDKRWLAE